MSDEERELIERMYRRMLMSTKEQSIGAKSVMCPTGIISLDNNNLNSMIKKCLVSVIDFYADWCVPCRIMEPILNKLAQVFAGKVFFGRVDVDEYPEVAAGYGVMSIPTTILLRNDEEVYRVIGAVDYNTMRRYIEIYLGVKP
ncbi:thioredoxin [Vulcanisaeta moutnovskia 768-28]|uniref:Thioredoxin n=1 Tax=Vulcanisaeta moutnovskia (strain 768-28) TaxID=985053 RepID=F0QTZ0_VULM7|nr:thioredoxin domain-containing protein [Vulcanisaeta moutnovskia]ADY01776.1 thioredoxin [Vulcanisaeta moutnovskia 768-28]